MRNDTNSWHGFSTRDSRYSAIFGRYCDRISKSAATCLTGSNSSFAFASWPEDQPTSRSTATHGLKTHATIMFAVLFLALFTGCRKEDMGEQPRYNPNQPSAFFEDGNSSRPLVEGTVTRSGGQGDGYEYYRSPLSTTAPAAAASIHTADANLAAADFPDDFPKSGQDLRRALERGRERYNIFCAVCHGQTGAGDGMIVQRGFIRPPAFYPLAADAKSDSNLYLREQNLLTVPPGYIVDKITNGYGAMYSYAARVAPADRWAIAVYVRVLQSSQMATLRDLPERDQKELEKLK